MLIALVVVVVMGVPSAAASPAPPPGFHADRARYVTGGVVTATLANDSRPELTMENPWVVRNRRTDQVVAFYNWSESDRVVPYGETRVWQWDGTGGCHGVCDEPGSGEPVGPGSYVAAAMTSLGNVRDRFEIGEFFTLGFTSRPALEFVVYVNRPDDVAAMRAEAETDDTDKQIVSGIVRRRKPYNRDWNFTMGPASIVLGDVFIEVCDGSPGYVQRHRSEWLGERWCPWSSYVKRVGR